MPAGLARPIARPLALCGSVVLPSMPKPSIARPLARRSLWIGGLALDSDADADAEDCASTCPQGLRVLWVPLLPKGRARTASVSQGAPSGSTYETTHLRVACACLLVFVVFVVLSVVSAASPHNGRRRPPMDARSLQADGDQNSRMPLGARRML